MQLFLEKVIEKTTFPYFLSFSPPEREEKPGHRGIDRVPHFFATEGINCILKILDLTFESKLDLYLTVIGYWI